MINVRKNCVKWSEGCSVVSNSLQPHWLSSPWNSPGQNTEVGSLSLLQGIFPTQGLNLGLLHCRRILYQLSHKGSPRILERVAYPSPVEIPDPGIEPGSLALQVGSLLTELWKKPINGVQFSSVDQSCPTLHDHMDYTVHGILQVRILKWVAFLFSRGSSQPSDRTQVSRIAGGFFTSWVTREAQEYWSG